MRVRRKRRKAFRWRCDRASMASVAAPLGLNAVDAPDYEAARSAQAEISAWCPPTARRGHGLHRLARSHAWFPAHPLLVAAIKPCPRGSSFWTRAEVVAPVSKRCHRSRAALASGHAATPPLAPRTAPRIPAGLELAPTVDSAAQMATLPRTGQGCFYRSGDDENAMSDSVAAIAILDPVLERAFSTTARYATSIGFDACLDIAVSAVTSVSRALDD